MAGVPRVDNFFVILPLVARVVSVGSPPPRKAATTLHEMAELQSDKALKVKKLRITLN